MSSKFSDDHKFRIPINIYRKNNKLYFTLKLYIIEKDGVRCSPAIQYFKIENIASTSLEEIGELTINLLKKFQRLGDLTLDELNELKKDPIESKLFYDGLEYKNFWDLKENDDINLTHSNIYIEYWLDNSKYIFFISWIERHGKHYYIEDSKAIGKKGVFTFDTPLEFTEFPEPEEMGKMVMEAFGRVRKMGEITSGDYYPPQNIELLNGSEVIVEAPRDKHFADYGDCGVGEFHQAYLYFTKEGADSSAEFYLGIAAELDCDMSEDNIRKAWEKLHGKAEFFEIKPTEHGIWKLRAEMRNKSIHRISYLLQIDESELLDCTMELRKPNSRKKLDEKLSALFEEFALRCKFKD